MTELQHTSYYPFGGIIADTLLTKGRDVQNRMYNGKEQDFSNNLFWLDYGARQYDPTRGQFTTPDPLAEKYYGWNYYTYCVNNPMNAIDPDGMWPVYSKDGKYLGDDGRNEEGKDLAFTGVANYNENGDITGFSELSQFTSNHTEFQIISNIVLQEGATNDPLEYLWIAHTANNAAKESNVSLLKKLMSGYSSVSKSKKTALATTTGTAKANAARAGVISVLSGMSDPTGGATLWDGTDLLAWGLNSPNGTPHNKFEEYASMSISEEIYNTYLTNNLATYKSGRVSYKVKNNASKIYNIPASVFTDAGNWSGGYFNYNTRVATQNKIKATGAVGRSIFWKKIK